MVVDEQMTALTMHVKDGHLGTWRSLVGGGRNGQGGLMYVYKWMGILKLVQTQVTYFYALSIECFIISKNGSTCYFISKKTLILSLERITCHLPLERKI